MSSKLRENLPVKGKYSPETLKIFDKHRAEWRKSVERTKAVYGKRAFIANGEAANCDGATKMLVMMMEQGEDVAQLLMKYDLSTCQATISRSVDVFTAFYVPEDVGWLKVEANGNLLGTFYGDYHELELDQILRESWTLPRSENESYLEYILWVSRQGKIGFVHNQEETIEIDGIVYKRLIFLQPVLPICQCCYAQILITTSNPCTVYLEGSIVDHKFRNDLIRNDMLGWVEDTKDD